MRKSNFEDFLVLRVYKLPELKKKYINASVLETPIKGVLDVDIGERGTKKKYLRSLRRRKLGGAFLVLKV